MKQRITEIKRMQKLAGIITENDQSQDLSPEQAANKAIQMAPKIEASPEIDQLAAKIAKNPNLMKDLEAALQKGGISMNEEIEQLDKSDMKTLALNFAKKSEEINERISSDPGSDTSSVGLGMASGLVGGTLAAPFSSAIASAVPILGTAFAGPAIAGALVGIGLFILARKVYLKMNPDL